MDGIDFKDGRLAHTGIHGKHLTGNRGAGEGSQTVVPL